MARAKSYKKILRPRLKNPTSQEIKNELFCNFAEILSLVSISDRIGYFLGNIPYNTYHNSNSNYNLSRLQRDVFSMLTVFSGSSTNLFFPLNLLFLFPRVSCNITTCRFLLLHSYLFTRISHTTQLISIIVLFNNVFVLSYHHVKRIQLLILIASYYYHIVH